MCVWFLPPNVTSICQPTDQGTLEALKKIYRRKLLYSTLLDDDNEDYVLKLKKVDFLDVTYWISESWSELDSLTITPLWRKLMHHKASDQCWGEIVNLKADGNEE